jgi:uncharacterized protein YcbX
VTTARVHQLWIFPVKSMRGTSVFEADVTAGGLAHDRAWAVVDSGGTTVSAAQEPRLRQVAARVVEQPGGPSVAIDVPGAGPGAVGAAADRALSQWLGRPLRLEHRGDAGYVDVAPVHLVSTWSMSDAAHAEQCDACDVSEPRANLVLDLGAAPGSGERDWVGLQVRVGSATLDVVRHPDHCLGAYAQVVHPGLLRVGDAVTVG